MPAKKKTEPAKQYVIGSKGENLVEEFIYQSLSNAEEDCRSYLDETFDAEPQIIYELVPIAEVFRVVKVETVKL